MKKKLTMVLLVFMFVLLHNKVEAKGYQYFEELEVVGNYLLLSEYETKDLEKQYKEVNKRKFMGWKKHYLAENVKVKFISETILSYYNDGTTPIDYDYSLKVSETDVFHVGATGNIQTTRSKDGKGFKNGLNASLKLEADFKRTIKVDESTQIKFKVDPQTQVNLYTYGEGKLTNGVAAHYLFWVRRRLGGFEYLVITTQYHRLEKVKI